MASSSTSVERAAVLEARDLRYQLDLGHDTKIDPFKVAALLDYHVVRLSLGDDHVLEGASTSREGRGFILVNSSKYRRRLRFTCAHEMGHLRLHDPDRWLIDTQDDISAGNRSKSRYEREANVFATELLMPERACRTLLGATADLESAVATIVREFDTSPHSAAIRLQELDQETERFDSQAVRALINEVKVDSFPFRERHGIRGDRRMAPLVVAPVFRRKAERLLRQDALDQGQFDELFQRAVISR